MVNTRPVIGWKTTEFDRGPLVGRIIRCGIGLIGILGVLTAAGAPVSDGPVPNEDLMNDVETLVTSFEARLDHQVHRYTGAVLTVVKDGGIAYVGTYGHANAAGTRPVDPFRTQFTIGSVSKTFTSVLIAQLIESGKIASIDEPANKYLPADMQLPDNRGATVTLRMLATHQAGSRACRNPNAVSRPPWSRWMRTISAPVCQTTLYRPIAGPIIRTLALVSWG